jgi:hypothetical protein
MASTQIHVFKKAQFLLFEPYVIRLMLSRLEVGEVYRIFRLNEVLYPPKIHGTMPAPCKTTPNMSRGLRSRRRTIGT